MPDILFVTWDGSFGINESVVEIIPCRLICDGEFLNCTIENFLLRLVAFEARSDERSLTYNEPKWVKAGPLVRPNELMMEFNDLIKLQNELESAILRKIFSFTETRSKYTVVRTSIHFKAHVKQIHSCSTPRKSSKISLLVHETFRLLAESLLVTSGAFPRQRGTLLSSFKFSRTCACSSPFIWYFTKLQVAFNQNKIFCVSSSRSNIDSTVINHHRRDLIKFMKPRVVIIVCLLMKGHFRLLPSFTPYKLAVFQKHHNGSIAMIVFMTEN